MDPSTACCPNLACPDKRQQGRGNMGIHLPLTDAPAPHQTDEVGQARTARARAKPLVTDTVA